jgi:ATP-dependent DNA helicase RecQ
VYLIIHIYFIQPIDRKTSLDDVAVAKGLTFEELLVEIERIVDSGTYLNIDYYIQENVDPYVQEEILDYYEEEAETDSWEDALKELGEDEYTEKDIRLMRIKYLSEVGN